jgi:hypothetical protein
MSRFDQEEVLSAEPLPHITHGPGQPGAPGWSLARMIALWDWMAVYHFEVALGSCVLLILFFIWTLLPKRRSAVRRY